MEPLETPNSLLWLDTRTTPHRGLACKHNNREPFGTPTHCHLQWVSQWPLGPQNPTHRNSAPRVNIMMNMHTPYQRQHCCTEASRATQQVAQGQHECMACMALVYSSTTSSRIYPKLCRTTYRRHTGVTDHIQAPKGLHMSRLGAAPTACLWHAVWHALRHVLRHVLRHAMSALPHISGGSHVKTQRYG